MIADNTTSERATVADRDSLNKYFILNVLAGKGHDSEAVIRADESLSVYTTEKEGDARRLTAEICNKDPYAWIIACGGDGTLSEAAAGIIDAGAGGTALLSPIGGGTGNDFVRYMNGILSDGEIKCIDALSVNGCYSINMVNIGFDCAVVSESEKLRKLPGFKGPSAYVLGVVKSLIRKPHIASEIHMYGVDGTDREETIKGEFLLTAIAECPYCGGGFNAAPTANPFDGLVDLLIVKNITRTRFIGLVGDYKKGTHFLEDGSLKEKFRDLMTHVRCRSFEMNGISEICVDGEISETSSISGTVIPKAVRCVMPKQKWIDAIKN